MNVESFRQRAALEENMRGADENGLRIDRDGLAAVNLGVRRRGAIPERDARLHTSNKHDNVLGADPRRKLQSASAVKI
jgi:hypothetical protein